MLLRDMNREQMWLLPPSLDELLPLDHPVRFVAEIVDSSEDVREKMRGGAGTTTGNVPTVP